MNRKILLLPLLCTALFLGACGQTTPGANLVQLTVRAPLGVALGAQRTHPQGIPSFDGAPLINVIKVKVLGQNGPLTFNDQNVFDINGTHDHIVLTPQNSSTQILVPQGTYTLESIGKLDTTLDGVDDGQFLAYGKNADVNLSGVDPTVTLEVHTLTDPNESSFVPASPLASVSLNQTVDSYLHVHTPVVGLSTSADVPTSDYQVLEYNAIGGTPGAGSPLGVKITADQPDGAVPQLSANVKLKAWVQTGAETAAEQEFTLLLEPIPFGLLPLNPGTVLIARSALKAEVKS